MIKTENYPKAYVEVYEILKYLDNKDKKLIPQKFINMIEKNKDNNYKFKLEDDKNLEEQVLMRESKAILSYIFVNYLSDEEEKQIIKNKFKNDILKKEEEKKKKFNNDIFDVSKATNKENASRALQNDNKQLIEYKKQGFVFRIVDKIKEWFNIFFNN